MVVRDDLRATTCHMQYWFHTHIMNLAKAANLPPTKSASIYRHETVLATDDNPRRLGLLQRERDI